MIIEHFEQVSQPNINKFDNYQRWRNAVYEALVESDMECDAIRWLDCDQYHRSIYNPEHLPTKMPKDVSYVLACSASPKKHPVIVQKHTCGLRYCPTCAEQHSARLISRYAPVALKLAQSSRRFRLRHIVLTTPYSLADDDIGEKYRLHQKNVRDLMFGMMKGEWRKKQGFIACDEFGEGGNKLHTHILHFGKYIAHEALTEGWKQVTGGECEVTWIKGIEPNESSITKRVSEILKYCTKFWRENEDGEKTMIDPYLIPKLANVLKGSRRVRTYGLFYNIEEELSDSVSVECLVCGSPMKKVWASDWQAFVESGYTWQEIDLLVKNDGLDLIPANKSKSETRIRGKPPDEHQLRLSGFESNSYDYEK